MFVAGILADESIWNKVALALQGQTIVDSQPLPDGTDRLRRLLGEGWGFPMRITVQGGFQLSHNYWSLEESISIILGTRLGERVYRPDFGSRLHELVFAPLNDETVLLAQIYAREALQQWEPRIVIEAVTAAPVPDTASLMITVNYRVRETRHRRSLVYPFYLNTSV